VFADLDDAHAHMIVDDLDVEDYHDVVNAILDGPSLEAEVSFKARWHGVRHRRHVRNAKQRFELHAVQTSATVEWTGPQRLGRLHVRPRSDVADRVRGARVRAQRFLLHLARARGKTATEGPLRRPLLV